MKSKIMKRAHQIVKTLIGDYYARLALALRQAWREAKQMVEEIKQEVKTITLNWKFQPTRFEDAMPAIDELKKHFPCKFNRVKKYWEVQLPIPQGKHRDAWKTYKDIVAPHRNMNMILVDTDGN